MNSKFLFAAVAVMYLGLPLAFAGNTVPIQNLTLTGEKGEVVAGAADHHHHHGDHHHHHHHHHGHHHFWAGATGGSNQAVPAPQVASK